MSTDRKKASLDPELREGAPEVDEDEDSKPLQSKYTTAEKAPPITDLDGAFGVFDRLRARLRAAVHGRDDVIDLVITAVLADGHVLREDFPGSGKTALAREGTKALSVSNANPWRLLLLLYAGQGRAADAIATVTRGRVNDEA